MSARDALIRRLGDEFGQFLEHEPHSPGRFWGQAADAILRDPLIMREVKAEALREAAAAYTPRVAVRAWLIETADRIARGDH